MAPGPEDGKPKGILDKLAEKAEFVKKLIGLLALIPPVASWYDPTFFDLLSINPVIAGQAFKYAAGLSVLFLAYLLITYWKSWQKPPADRGINLRRNLVAALIIIPVTFVSIDLTATYQATHPLVYPASGFWRRMLLIAEYVAFVSLSVLLLARIALRLYPQKSGSTSTTQQA